MRKIKIQEGLRKGDLADLVLPLISVDEYVASIDPEECIAFGFYVHDKDAANDFNRFLQKSPYPILDCQISPAPDQHGYWMVFVELMNNTRLPEVFTNILAEIKDLIDIEQWQLRIRGIEDLITFSEENLKDCLKKLPKTKQNESIIDFFNISALSDVSIENDTIILEGMGDKFVFTFVEFSRTDDLLSKLNETISYNIKTVARANRIEKCLGAGWSVHGIGKKNFLLTNEVDPRGLLLSY